MHLIKVKLAAPPGRHPACRPGCTAAELGSDWLPGPRSAAAGAPGPPRSRARPPAKRSADRPAVPILPGMAVSTMASVSASPSRTLVESLAGDVALVDQTSGQTVWVLPWTARVAAFFSLSFFQGGSSATLQRLTPLLLSNSMLDGLKASATVYIGHFGRTIFAAAYPSASILPSPLSLEHQAQPLLLAPFAANGGTSGLPATPPGVCNITDLISSTPDRPPVESPSECSPVRPSSPGGRWTETWRNFIFLLREFHLSAH